MNSSNLISESKKLEVRIERIDAELINEAIKKLLSEPLTVNRFFDRIKNENIKSSLYQALKGFLSLVENTKKRTYPDTEEHMTIGIGFNLDQPGAEAAIWELDPTLDFLTLKNNEGQPDKGLTDEQIDKLLYLSLIGVNNEKGSFKGLADQLKDRLTHFGIAHIQFKPHQLIALQSLAFNNPGKLIGPQLCKALKTFDETKHEHDLMVVLQQIMECSNKLFNQEGQGISYAHGIQNRRMREAGMFLGDPAAIHISYRQYKRIEAAYATLGVPVIPINGQPIYAQLYGEEYGYHGDESTRIKEVVLKENEQYLATYYGSKHDETIEIDSKYLHPIVYSGDGNNIIHLPENHDWSYPYIAGGSGANHYKISSNAGKVLINDTSGRGKITIDDKHRLQGIALATDDTKQNYQLTCHEKTYQLRQTVLAGTDVQQMNINWGDTENDITLHDFNSGQLQLVLAQAESPTEINANDFASLPILLPKTGHFVFLCVTHRGTEKESLIASIVNSEGKPLREIQLASFAGNKQSVERGFQLSQHPIAVLDNGNFIVVWGCSVTRRQSLEDIQETKTQGAMCSEEGFVEPFDVVLPDGTSSASLVTKYVDLGDGRTIRAGQYGTALNIAPFEPPQVFSRENRFAILFSGGNINKDSSRDSVQQILMCYTYGRSAIITTRNGYDTYFLPTFASLANGDFAIALRQVASDHVSHLLTTHILNPNGMVNKSFSHGMISEGFFVSLTPLGEGFMFVIKDTTSLRSTIYDGHDWGAELNLHSPTDYPVMLSGALKNGYTLVSWKGLSVTKEHALNVVLIDSNNQVIGDAATFLSGTFGMPHHIGETAEGNTTLKFIMPGKSGLLLQNYLLKTAMLPTVKYQNDLQSSQLNHIKEIDLSSENQPLVTGESDDGIEKKPNEILFMNQSFVLFSLKNDKGKDTGDAIDDFVFVGSDVSEEKESPKSCVI